MNTTDDTNSTADTTSLLISDVDDTLTGDDAALQRLSDALRAQRPRLLVAVNSSRPAPSVQRTLDDQFPAGFPLDAMITAMGTEVRINGTPVAAWSKRFEGWPRDKIEQVVLSLGHRAHDAEFQTPYKASFAVEGAEALLEVTKALENAGLPCRLIASGKDDLDILPPGAGKDHATLFLAEQLGAGKQGFVVAGDSANDLAMFRVAPRAIAVGNARAELIDAMPRETSYHARAKHAAGVHEGLKHYRLFP